MVFYSIRKSKEMRANHLLLIETVERKNYPFHGFKSIEKPL